MTPVWNAKNPSPSVWERVCSLRLPLTAVLVSKHLRYLFSSRRTVIRTYRCTYYTYSFYIILTFLTSVCMEERTPLTHPPNVSPICHCICSLHLFIMSLLIYHSTGQVIKGLDIGVSSMQRGEVCMLLCKPEYAYGSAGCPPKIPPNAMLQFEVGKAEWFPM